jgi:hypothetical protein
VFGLISVIALTVNVMLLVALLSLLQATLTLPGIAALALTLGMAIDANVLINERVREELRRGATPQQAIATGYEKAFATILDSNVTTLIAGVFAAGVRLGADPRLRGRALPGHPDLDVLGGVRLARRSSTSGTAARRSWRRSRSARSGRAARRPCRSRQRSAPTAAPGGSKDMEFFRISATFRSCATRCILNAISVVVFVRGRRAVHPRAEPVDRVHRRHGDGDRLPAGGRPGAIRVRRRGQGLGRVPGAELRHLARRADPAAGAARHERSAQQSRAGDGRAEGADAGVELRRVEFVGPQVGEELAHDGTLALLFVSSAS